MIIDCIEHKTIFSRVSAAIASLRRKKEAVMGCGHRPASSSSRYLFSLTWPMSGYLLQTTRFRGPSAQSAGGHPWVQDACQRIAGKIADPIADSSLGSHNDVTAAGNPCNQSPGAATQSPLFHGDQTLSRPPGRAFFTLRFLQGNNEM